MTRIQNFNHFCKSFGKTIFITFCTKTTYSADTDNTIFFNTVKTIFKSFRRSPANIIYNLNTVFTKPITNRTHSISIINFQSNRHILVSRKIRRNYSVATFKFFQRGLRMIPNAFKFIIVHIKMHKSYITSIFFHIIIINQSDRYRFCCARTFRNIKFRIKFCSFNHKRFINISKLFHCILIHLNHSQEFFILKQ